MNYKMMFNVIGKIMAAEAVCLMLSAIVGALYLEASAWYLLLGAIIAFAIFAVSKLFKPKDDSFFAKEGLVSVALSWVLMALVGALPFCLSGEIPNIVDAVFEVTSGLSTTGATVVVNLDSLSHGILFWRSLTHWIGGMGVLVLVMAIAPSVTGRSIHMLRAEMPGPIIGKLVPKAKTTARVLYIIYIALTVILALLLVLGGMPLFESVLHAFGTAGTGGFGAKADSIASYSPYIQWVITVFMLIFGINFNLFYFILIKKFSSAFKSEEFWWYVGIVILSTAMISINIMPQYQTSEEAIRHGAFQVAAIISTTGYTTVDINTMPQLSKTILLCLMFLGGCAGSTAGGLKVSRLILLCKTIKNRIVQVVHPRALKAVKFEGKAIEEETSSGVLTYFALYCFCQIVLLIVLSFDRFGFQEVISATASSFNNVGPSFGRIAAGYAEFSDFSKIAMSFAMLFGRLEIYPMLILFLPSTWRKK